MRRKMSYSYPIRNVTAIDFLILFFTQMFDTRVSGTCCTNRRRREQPSKFQIRPNEQARNGLYYQMTEESWSVAARR